MTHITSKRLINCAKNSQKSEGRVIKSASNLFVVDADFGMVSCVARKNAKLNIGEEGKLQRQKRYEFEAKNSNIIAGDFVRLEKGENNEWIIIEVKKRKNSLIRPQVANIDQVLAIVAPIPKPDFSLIDKLIINSVRQGIDIVLCLNKTDLDDGGLLAELTAQYGGVVKKIIYSCAKKGDIGLLKKVLLGKLTALAGQSAVGKSSIINALTKSEKQKTDALSEKIGRGKNTTTRAEIIKLSPKTYVIDTPGFSMLDIHGILEGELDLYYNEYVKESGDCKYNRCTHTTEPNCKIRELVESGELNMARYERYCQMHFSLKNKKGF